VCQISYATLENNNNSTTYVNWEPRTAPKLGTGVEPTRESPERGSALELGVGVAAGSPLVKGEDEACWPAVEPLPDEARVGSRAG
jgi:hypothetical protein